MRRLLGRHAGRAFLLAAVLLIAASATAAAPASSKPQAEPWKARAGDDPRWANPAFDDSAWPAVPLPATWKKQGFSGLDGYVWFRREVRLDPEARLAAARGELSLLLGASRYGGYEVYAGGQRVGASRGWPARLAFPSPKAFPIPREAIRVVRSAGAGGAQGAEGEIQTLSLALRVRRVAWASDADPLSEAVEGLPALGSHPAFEDRLQAEWKRKLLGELPLLLLAALFAAVALVHLLLFSRDRRQAEYLWFGLLALAFAVNTFASTYWIYEVTLRRDVAARWTGLSGHLAAALALQFLWHLFGRRVSLPSRAYQLSHVALAAFVGLWPDPRAIIASDALRSAWLLPLLIGAAVLILWEARRGDADARTIAAGGLAMIAIQGVELGRRLLPLAWAVPFSLAGFGFAAMLLSMGVALSNRFRRVHDELGRLRLHLEEQVQERTRELAEARDQALAASRAKSEFLANVSHEIRTPLNGVIGTADLLALTPLTPAQQRYVEALQISGDALLRRIEDILDFSRTESRTLRLEHVPFRLREVVEESFRIIAPLASQAGLGLRAEIGPDLPEVLMGDGGRVGQILVNLLSNAVKFTPQGEVRVEATARPLPIERKEGEERRRGGFEVQVTVRDTGIGIASGDLPRLFTPFQQLDGSASRRYGGVGLGLAISKRLTELMSGRIWVESAP
ncbi:MAG TPA: ATP-binding protein, partial [Thermoanaerobaculia bacterium]|nr:ATP-binding protein [Thermoanaerobaculia bacterium]